MKTATPTAAGLRHRAATRRRARFGLFAFTATSVAFNVAVILEQPHTVLRLFLAGLAPVMLAFMGDLLASYQQSDMIPSGTAEKSHKWTRRAVGAIAFGAFALSFQTLHTAAVPDHGWLVAFLFPLTLDLAIWVCTWMRVVIARADEHDQAAGVTPPLGWWAARRERKNPAPVRMAATVFPRPTEQTAEPEQVAVRRAVAHELLANSTTTQREVMPPQTAPTAATQLVESAPLRDLVTAPQPTSTPDPVPASTPAHREADRDADTDEIRLTSSASREPATTRRDVELSLRRLAVVPAPRRDREAERDVTRTSPIAPTAAQGDVDREAVRDVDPEPAAKEELPMREADRDVTGEVEVTSTLTEAGPLRDAEPDVVHRELAQRVVDAGRTTVSVDDTAAVIAAKTAGLSNRKASDATGVGESAVQRIWTAARELSDSVPVA